MLASIDRKTQEARAQPISPLQPYPSLVPAARLTPVLIPSSSCLTRTHPGAAAQGRESWSSRRTALTSIPETGDLAAAAAAWYPRRAGEQPHEQGRLPLRRRGAAARAGEQPQVPLPLKRCLLPSPLRALCRPRSLRSARVRSSSAGRRSTTTAPFNTTSPPRCPPSPKSTRCPSDSRLSICLVQ